MIDPSLQAEVLGALLKGAAITIQIAIAASVLSIVLAFVVGLARGSSFLVLRAAAAVYVEVLRGSSLLVQLFILYYLLPLFGISWDAMTTGIVGLALNFGAYGSEIVRAAVANVDRGQREAAVALNLSPAYTMAGIVLPQAILAMLPPFGNTVVEILKATSLVSLITIGELTFTAKTVVSTYGHVDLVYALVLLMYFALAFPLTRMTRVLERRFGTGMQLGRG
jgi:polar amino acid transport system permease protein